MATTYTLIEGKTLTSTTANVLFSSIPQTYTDLVLRTSTRISSADNYIQMQVQLNSTTANYSARQISNFGTTISTTSTTSATGAYSVGNNAVANTFGNNEIYISNYTGSNFKSYSSDSNASTTTNNRLDLRSGLWSNSTAVTSLNITPFDGSSFLENSTFYLYGINNS
jgi:hypothetical protein